MKRYVVGLPDTQGGMCWLAGYDSDPTRYYTASLALRFASEKEAEAGIESAEFLLVTFASLNKSSRAFTRPSSVTGITWPTTPSAYGATEIEP